MPLNKELTIPEELLKLANEEFESDFKTSKVVIKRFRFGDVVQIYRDSMKIKANLGAGTATADVDPAEMRIKNIVTAVVEAPWPVNDDASVKNLPVPVAEWISTEIDSFNNLEVKKKMNSQI